MCFFVFISRFTSFTTLKSNSQVAKYKTKVKGKMGYWVTAQLSSEAAITVLEDKKKFCVQGGIARCVSDFERWSASSWCGFVSTY
jgi:hypothetical protein